MMGGSVVIERVFEVKGIGRLEKEDVERRDKKIMIGVIIKSEMMVIIVNLVIDIVYIWIEKRIEEGGREWEGWKVI